MASGRSIPTKNEIGSSDKVNTKFNHAYGNDAEISQENLKTNFDHGNGATKTKEIANLGSDARTTNERRKIEILDCSDSDSDLSIV